MENHVLTYESKECLNSCLALMHQLLSMGHAGTLVMVDDIICMSSRDEHPIKSYCCVRLVITV